MYLLRGPVKRSYRMLPVLGVMLLLVFQAGSLWEGFWSWSAGPVVVGTGRYRLSRPLGVALDDRGNLYVADTGNNRLVVFDRQGRGKRIIGENLLLQPMAVAVSRESRIYVSNYGQGVVSIFSPEGNQLGTLPAERDATLLTGFRPLAIATDSRGNVYVADSGQQQVVVFDRNGRLTMAFGSPGNQPGRFSYVNGLVVDEIKNRIVALDSNNLRLQSFNFSGRLIEARPILEKGSSAVVAPRGLAYDAKTGLFYVGDALKDSVLVMDGRGTVVGALARPGTKQLSYPGGLALDGRGHLYVADRENHRVTILPVEGR